eukprot:Hpha_TRINITY_DN15764_c0_g1::TRINITY_DN15764_c0_g1_i1::g.41072::m.41072
MADDAAHDSERLINTREEGGEETPKKGRNWVPIVVLVVLVLAGVGVLLYFLVFKKDDNDTTSPTSSPITSAPTSSPITSAPSFSPTVADAQALALSNFAAHISPLPGGWGGKTGECNGTWEGVTCTDQTVTGIDLNRKTLRGEPDLTALPHGLKSLDLTGNLFDGTPDLTSLPPSLETLLLNGNCWSGTPTLTGLPAGMLSLALAGTPAPPYGLVCPGPHGRQPKFSGTPNLTALPAGLKSLQLDANYFTGTPDLLSLPTGLGVLDISNNLFEGTPNLTALPHVLTELRLYGNRFAGNGTFSTHDSTGRPSIDWCRCNFCNCQAAMCESGSPEPNGVFDCEGGTWSCGTKRCN